MNNICTVVNEDAKSQKVNKYGITVHVYTGDPDNGTITLDLPELVGNMTISDVRVNWYKKEEEPKCSGLRLEHIQKLRNLAFDMSGKNNDKMTIQDFHRLINNREEAEWLK